MSQSSPLDIVIAGGGTAGWIAAATFARFLGNRASITLVESDEIGTVGVGEATIPQIHNLVIGLGLDQADFVRRTNATFKLGIEFSGWNGERESYIHSFGQTGRGVGLIPFRQLWLRGRGLGVAADYGDYSFNIAAARLGRMAKEGGGSSTIPDLAYAYHFDASLFALMLRDYSEERGVRRIEGKIVEVERDPQSGDIAALALDGERRIAGTFFLDCTGFRKPAARQGAGRALSRLEPLAAVRFRACRAVRVERSIPALYPGDGAPRRLAMADPVAASHRERTCLLFVANVGRRGDRASPRQSRWQTAGRSPADPFHQWSAVDFLVA